MTTPYQLPTMLERELLVPDEAADGGVYLQFLEDRCAQAEKLGRVGIEVPTAHADRAREHLVERGTQYCRFARLRKGGHPKEFLYCARISEALLARGTVTKLLAEDLCAPVTKRERDAFQRAYATVEDDLTRICERVSRVK